MKRPSTATLLFVNVLVVASCGLIYELLAGTVGSYVLGDSVTQFSLVIGLYLSAMGVGAWLSRHLRGKLARRFVEVELAVALVGGLSAPLLFLAFARLDSFRLALYGDVVVIGILVGLELPLLMRLLGEQMALADLVSRVLTFDYIGALVAALAFPLLLVPELGLVRSSLVVGLANAAVGLWGTWLLAPQIGRGVYGLRARAVVVMAILVAMLIKADSFTRWSEEQLFADDIVFTRDTAYQRIVVTEGPGGFSLFLNGNLQFASADEYRYHEALVHPALAASAPAPRRVLILGGGDGLAAREVLRHPAVTSVTLIDLDPAMTRLAREFPPLRQLNRAAFDDPRVTIVNDDAMVWLDEHPGEFDAAIVDFPDPNSYALGKLYTTRFYKLLAAHLHPDAAVAVQATSPLFARHSFWTIIRTMEEAGLHVRPYQVAVPSFGVWGYALARRTPFPVPDRAPAGSRFLNDDALAAMFVFPADLGPVDVEINRLDNQVLVRTYEREWRRWE